MTSIRNVFWNSDQRRLRALWRVMGQVFLLIAIMIGAQIAVGTFVLGAVVAGGELNADQLSDPQGLQQLIMQDPRLMVVLQLSTGVSIILSVWIAGRFLDQRPFADFGFHLDRNWWVDLGFGMAQGAALMLLIFLIELAVGWITITDTFATRHPEARFLPAILPSLVTFLAVGFYEELFSRGYQLQNLAEGLNWGVIGPRGAIFIATALSSAVFGVLHAMNPNATPISTLYLIIAGCHLATGYLLTGELAIPVGQHITWNFFQGNVFGFPVSGTDFRSATFIRIEQGGPQLWTGGPFGPEAGFIGLAAMIVGVLWTIAWVRWRRGEVGLRLSLAQPPERRQENI
jgi:membrane protease YdiL (CAAX protease family)